MKQTLLALALLGLALAGCSSGSTPAPPDPGLSRAIVFDGYANGNNDLFRVNPDGTGLTKLTDTKESEHDPALSPDRTRIAFLRSGTPTRVMWMNSDGTGITEVPLPATLGTRNDVAWLPGGDRLVVSAGLKSSTTSPPTTVLAFMNLDGSDVTMLDPETTGETYRYTPDVSPDGTRIVCTVFEPNHGTFVGEVGLDGKNAKRLIVEDESTFHRVRYSPDGQKLAYNWHAWILSGTTRTQAIELYTADASGGNRRKIVSGTTLADDIRGFAWSAGGTKLIYSRQARGIFIANADGSGERQIASGSQFYGGVSW